MSGTLKGTHSVLTEQAAAWGFPESLCGSFVAHHDPAAAPECASGLAALVQAAHALGCGSFGGWSDASGRERDAALLADLGLLPDDVAALRAETESRLKSLSLVYR